MENHLLSVSHETVKIVKQCKKTSYMVETSCAHNYVRVEHKFTLPLLKDMFCTNYFFFNIQFRLLLSNYVLVSYK